MERNMKTNQSNKQKIAVPQGRAGGEGGQQQC